MKNETEQGKEDRLQELKDKWQLGAFAFIIGGTVLAFALGDYIDLRIALSPAWLVLVFYLVKIFYLRWFSK